jgi:ABC-2 type transport system permease protein
MIASIKAEFRKLWTVRSTYVIFIAAFLIAGLFAFYAEGIKAPPAAVHDTGKLASEVMNAVTTLSLIGALAGVLLMTHEYRYNTIMYTLTSSNSRLKTLVAKIVAATAFSIIFTVVFACLAPFMTWLGMSIKGLTLDPQQWDLFSLAWRSLFVGWAFQMIGLVIAVLLRNQIGTIVLIFMSPATIEPLLGLLLKHNAFYLPFSATIQVMQHQTTGTSPETMHIAMSYGKAAVVVLIYLVIAWAAAALLFRWRDAN